MPKFKPGDLVRIKPEARVRLGKYADFDILKCSANKVFTVKRVALSLFDLYSVFDGDRRYFFYENELEPYLVGRRVELNANFYSGFPFSPLMRARGWISTVRKVRGPWYDYKIRLERTSDEQSEFDSGRTVYASANEVNFLD